MQIDFKLRKDALKQTHLVYESYFDWHTVGGNLCLKLYSYKRNKDIF